MIKYILSCKIKIEWLVHLLPNQLRSIYLEKVTLGTFLNKRLEL